jgi:hypothetical protein
VILPSNNFSILISTSPSNSSDFGSLRVIHSDLYSIVIRLIDRYWFKHKSDSCAAFEYTACELVTYRYLSSRGSFSGISPSFYCYIWLHIQTLSPFPKTADLLNTSRQDWGCPHRSRTSSPSSASLGSRRASSLVLLHHKMKATAARTLLDENLRAFDWNP